MEVILREDIEKLGHRGEVVKVAPGYARNFLLPKRLAVLATDANRKIVEQEREAYLRKEAKAQERSRGLGPHAQRRNDHDHAARRRRGSAVRFGHRQGHRRALERQNYHIDRRKIQLEDPIKNTGEYKVPVRLHREVTADLNVNVVAE